MKQLLILSGKGGTGKTTIASAFIKLLEAKAYADCDVDAPNLHLIMKQDYEPIKSDYFGLPKAVIDSDVCVKCNACLENCRFDAINIKDGQYIVDHYACEGCGVCKAVCPVEAVALKPAVAGELFLYNDDAVFSTARLRMGSGTSGKLVTKVKTSLREAADAKIAIIDGSPGIGCPVIASLSGVDLVLIVTEPSVSGISDMERIIKTADNFKTNTVICINKYDVNESNSDKIEAFCKDNEIPLVGKIPFDKNAVIAVNEGKSVIDIDTAASEAIKDVYDKTMHILADNA